MNIAVGTVIRIDTVNDSIEYNTFLLFTKYIQLNIKVNIHDILSQIIKSAGFLVTIRAPTYVLIRPIRYLVIAIFVRDEYTPGKIAESSIESIDS